MAIFAFVFGLMFGSFLNVCIYRIPLALPDEEPDDTVLRSTLAGVAAWNSVCVPARSFCPKCRSLIHWYDNLPVLSWLLLGGRCRNCGVRISTRYAIVELLTAVLFLAGYLHFGFTLDLLKFWVFTFLLIALIFTDAEHRLLPDAFTLPGVIAGVIFSLFIPVNDVVMQYWSLVAGPSPSWRILSFCDSLLGAALGAAFIFGSGMIYKLARGREGMGLGDAKLMAMIGAFLGPKPTVLTIFGASLLGTFCGLLMLPLVWLKRLHRRIRRNQESGATARRRAWASARLLRYYALPFGVFLGTMAFVAVFWGRTLFHWYWSYL